MREQVLRSSFLIACSIALLAACIGLSLALGFAWGRSGAPSSSPVVLKADTANGGKNVSIATGLVDIDVEGCFILDHMTGNLFCILINPRSGQEVGLFQTNVLAQLGQNRVGELDWVLATGRVDFGAAGRTGNLRPALCMCYVVEGNSGRAFGYSLTYNQTQLMNNVRQEGPLALVWQGMVRAGAIQRD